MFVVSPTSDGDRSARRPAHLTKVLAFVRERDRLAMAPQGALFRAAAGSNPATRRAFRSVF